MALIPWVKEWGIFSQRDRMSLGDMLRWFRQWVPFGFSTIWYGTVSLLAGPFSPRRWISAWAMRKWAQASLQRLAIQVELIGAENVPSGALVYASNHQSLLDTLVHAAWLPGEFKWAAKRSVFNIPFLGWHLALAGHVPVDRGRGREAALATMDRFVEVLRKGFPLLVFPEGSRSTDCQVKKFKDGGFVAAVRGGAPVVPVALHGTGSLMSKGAADSGEQARQDRKIRVVIGRPIHASTEIEDEDERVADLRQRTRDAVVAMHADLVSGRQR